MSRRMHRIASAAAVLALLGGVSACGGEEGDEEGDVQATATANVDPSSLPDERDPSTSVSGEQAVEKEKNPPGDIPDNIAFVEYTSPSGGYTFKRPEGFAKIEKDSAVTFRDKLVGFHMEVGTGTTQPSVDSVKKDEVAGLESANRAFQLEKVSKLETNGYKGVKILYLRNSEPDKVTGKQHRDEVERYELFHNGKVYILEMFGPVGADNVDDYKLVLKSLKLP